MQTKITKQLFLMLVGTWITCVGTFAQIHLKVHIKDSKQQAVDKAEVYIQQGDSTIDFGIASKGEYTATLPKEGKYNIQVACIGFTPYHAEKDITQNSEIDVSLKAEAIQLDEVAVTGKRLPKTTATGSVYTLSQKAKECGNPFKALSEIPLLRVDISNQTVQMANGESPLILIDGKMFNSGIAPIDPSRIESVEISEVVSARYLQMGVSKLINIKLRKDTPWYEYVEMRTRHDIPFREGFGGANFEFGKKKFAIAGNLFGWYKRNDKNQYEINESNQGINKYREGESNNRYDKQESYLLLKWTPSSSDYFSAFFRGLNNDNRTTGDYNGLYTNNNITNPFIIKQSNIASNGGMLGSVYYEHTFKDKSSLTTYAKYNYGYANSNQKNIEEYTDNTDETIVDYTTKRDQYTASIDYDSGEKKYGNITSGASAEYTKDKDNNLVPTPNEQVKTERLNSFAYLAYANHIGKLYYMGSVGAQLLHINAEGVKSTRWRPKASASITWQLPHQQVLNVNYTLSNSLPESSQLVTYNTSTNPWYRIEGNPYLEPVMGHNIQLKYDKTMGNFMLRIYGIQSRLNKRIDSYIRTENDIQIQSYHNNGTYVGNVVGAYMFYQGKSLLASYTCNYAWEKYNGQPSKKLVDMDAMLKWDFGHFFIYTTLEWQSRSYDAITRTVYHNPINAQIHLAWQINKQFYAAIGLPYYWGIKSNTTTTEMGDYCMSNKVKFKSESLRPWLLLTWTFRKNPKLSIANKIPDL